MAFNLKAATPDTSLPTSGFVFGADSQSATDPSIYSVETLAAALLSSTTPLGGILYRGTDILEQRNGTNAQTFRLYNTYTDASNYERGFMRWSSNVLEIGAEAAGTGTQRSVKFTGAISTLNSGKISIETSGQPTVGIGRNGSIGGLDLFGDGLSTPILNISSSAVIAASGFAIQWSGSSITQPADTILIRAAAGSVGVRGSSASTGGALSFIEQTAPSAPAANGVYIYAEDNGSGKTRLMALFNTGAAQQIAIEP